MKKKPQALPHDDQSVFVDEQDLVQAPPNEVARLEYVRENEDDLRMKRKRTLILFFGVVLVLSSTYALLTFLQPTPPPPVVVEPTPTPVPIDPTALEAELKRIDTEVNMANPLTKPLIPPPVDMDVEF